MTKKSILGVIPARYASTRFPAKALADINGKPMIRRVYEQAIKSKLLTDVVVATDHKLIFDTIKSFGGNVIMTSENHLSGTDRCFETLTKMDQKYDYVINIQGDEPFIEPDQIDILASLLDGNTELATLIFPFNDQEILFNPNAVKVIFNTSFEAIYFSRNPIPFVRNFPKEKWTENHQFYRHIGIYAYRTDILEKITSLKPSKLELIESLEQLRWIENGFKIKVKPTQYDSFGIDTPEDLEYLLKKLNLNI